MDSDNPTMGQENIPPEPSAIPRLATPTKAATGIPLPKGRPAALVSVAGEKRKQPASPAPAPREAKRSVSGGTMGSLRQSQRGAASFAPQPRTAGTSAAARSTASRPTTRSSTGSSSSTSTRAPSRPATAASNRTVPARSALPAPRKAAPPATAGARPRVGPATSTGIRRPAAAPTRSLARIAGRAGSTPKEDDDRLGQILDLVQQEQAKVAALQNAHAQLNSRMQNQQESLAVQQRREIANSSQEMALMKTRYEAQVADLEDALRKLKAERNSLEIELNGSLAEREKLRQTIREQTDAIETAKLKARNLESEIVGLTSHNSTLKDEVDTKQLTIATLKGELQMALKIQNDAKAAAEDLVREAHEEAARRVEEIEEELRRAETIRRKLHNQVQELKGNIRVFARVRPALPHEKNGQDLADIDFGDERLAEETGQSQIIVTSRSESATGKELKVAQKFAFDKVFQPRHGQQDVFEEISMLAQSVLDGYNVCIFAYGQTGSGKSWTMEGGQNPEDVGMIPRAIDMIFAVSAQLKQRGWKYTMEGTFLEVYNDVINDLLGSGQFDSKKHEIKIDRDKMTVTDVVSLPLQNANQVGIMLERARKRRSVAATLMNERSSRSHSVFALKVVGTNAETGEASEGILNLVDLAGSERLASSGAGENKDRLKETININKSLSALADVIGALGQGREGGHVPYRNSTLTRLLQTSLSGTSKTLMLCNISPLAAHLGETVCSLRFATKVNSTPAGTARRSAGRASG